MFLRILNFCLDFFSHEGKQLHKKGKVNLKIYEVINQVTNNYNTYIAQYLKKRDDQEMKFVPLIENNVKNTFLQKPCRKRDRETSF